MFYCEIMGGLGNQLFQIFTNIAYGLKNKHTFLFPNAETVGKRNTYWNNFLVPLKQYTIKTRPPVKVIREKGFEYNDIDIPGLLPHQNVMLVGYFQSEKYFKEHYDTIYKMCGFDTHKMNLDNEYPRNYSTVVSMHFRLGDYKQLQDHHPILPHQYYKAALQHIQSKTSTVTQVLVFCEEEDMEIVESHITLLKKSFPSYTFLKVKPDIPDWKQMILMSLCKYNIIANSSFSWWGAYLNTNPHKMVLYPDVWFGPALKQNNTCDLFPPSWTRVSCKEEVSNNGWW